MMIKLSCKAASMYKVIYQECLLAPMRLLTLGCVPEHLYRHPLLCSPVVWHQNKVSASLYYSYKSDIDTNRFVPYYLCNYVNKGKLVFSNDICLFLSLDFSKQMHTLTGSRCFVLGGDSAHTSIVHRGLQKQQNWMFLVAVLTDKDLKLCEWWLFPFIVTLLQSQRTSLQGG